MPEAVRMQAFEALEALARGLGHNAAAASFERLMAMASACRELSTALAPHGPPLQAVMTLSLSIKRSSGCGFRAHEELGWRPRQCWIFRTGA